MDIQCEILPVPFEDIATAPPGEPSETIRRRVVAARAIQQQRFATEPGIHCNAEMNSRLLNTYCRLLPECLDILRTAMPRYDMSARAYDRILKVARTIADLEYSAVMEAAKAVSTPVLSRHIAEAIGYRNLDRASYGQVF